MAEKHIISAFDEDIEKIQSTLMKMGGLVEKSLFDAAAALGAFMLYLPFTFHLASNGCNM